MLWFKFLIFWFFHVCFIWGGRDFVPIEVPCAGDNPAVCHVAGMEPMCKC